MMRPDGATPRFRGHPATAGADAPRLTGTEKPVAVQRPPERQAAPRARDEGDRAERKPLGMVAEPMN